MLITSGPALARALYDREQEGLPSLQTLIYKTCSFWNWLWPLPHLQWTSALHCMGFLISLRCSLCSLISHVLFFCWDIKVCTVTLAHSWTLAAYIDTHTHMHARTHAHTHSHKDAVLRHEVVKSGTSFFVECHNLITSLYLFCLFSSSAKYFNLLQSSTVTEQTCCTFRQQIHI